MSTPAPSGPPSSTFDIAQVLNAASQLFAARVEAVQARDALNQKIAAIDAQIIAQAASIPGLVTALNQFIANLQAGQPVA